MKQEEGIVHDLTYERLRQTPNQNAVDKVDSSVFGRSKIQLDQRFDGGGERLDESDDWRPLPLVSTSLSSTFTDGSLAAGTDPLLEPEPPVLSSLEAAPDDMATFGDGPPGESAAILSRSTSVFTSCLPRLALRPLFATLLARAFEAA